MADEDNCTTNVEGVFAGGDAVTGPKTVIEAIAAGKNAATTIDQFLRGKPLEREHRIPDTTMYMKPETKRTCR